MNSSAFKMRCASLILMSAGYGWAGGHYIPADSFVIAYSFQFIVIILLVIMGVHFLSKGINEQTKSTWSAKGLTIFSIIVLVANIANIIQGVYTKDARSFGSHNSFADLVPIVIIIIGSIVWLATVIRKE